MNDNNKSSIVDMYKECIKLNPNNYIQATKNSDFTVACHADYINELATSTDTVLDLGCGVGALYLASHIYPDKYYGKDLVPEFIEINKNNSRSSVSPNHFEVYDLESMNLDRNYDIIVMNDVLNYFPTDRISQLVDYYFTKCDKALSFTLYNGLTEEECREHKLQPTDQEYMMNYLLSRDFSFEMRKTAPPDRLRFTLFKCVSKFSKNPYIMSHCRIRSEF